jgi:hypothetical protein
LYLENAVEAVHPVVCVMNKISEMFIPSNTTYIILKFKIGYMFRPCGVIVRPLQFDEAVRHKQDNEQINNIFIARRDPEWFTYIC